MKMNSSILSRETENVSDISSLMLFLLIIVMCQAKEPACRPNNLNTGELVLDM